MKATRLIRTVVIAVALALAAAARYPGGTLLSVSSTGYSLTRNFLSDLGMTVAYNGQSNKLGALLFVVSLLLLVASLGRSSLATARELLTVGSARAWATAGGLLTVLACLAFVGVALTPENQVMAVHVNLTLWAWRLSALAAWLFGVASIRVDESARRRTVALVLLALSLTTYVAYLALGPTMSALDGLQRQVLAQKVISVIAVSLLMYLDIERRRRVGARIRQ